jgi:hypothetical protein
VCDFAIVSEKKKPYSFLCLHIVLQTENVTILKNFSLACMMQCLISNLEILEILLLLMIQLLR